MTSSAADEALRQYIRAHNLCRVPRLRLLAATAVLVHHARISKDVKEVINWSDIVLSGRADLAGSPHEEILQSLVLRAASFGPFFRGQGTETMKILDECESLAYQAPADTPDLALLKAENIHAMLETRSRASQRMGDLDQARAYALDLARHDPLDARVHRDLGHMMLRHSGPAEAVEHFEKAAALGPPFSSIAWYLAGYCHSQIGAKDRALRAFLRGACLDRGSPTLMTAIMATAAETNDVALGRWAASRLEDLPPLPPVQKTPAPWQRTGVMAHG
jgi:tetratricopeptide (TPR) repeat protein